MAKLLVFVLALCMLGYFGYQTMYGAKMKRAEDNAAHAPKRQLDNVRSKAAEFEARDQANFDALEKKTTGE